MRTTIRGKIVEVREVEIEVSDFSGKTFYKEDHAFVNGVDVMRSGFFNACETKEDLFKSAQEFVEAGIL